jgi:hypothetical protein
MSKEKIETVSIETYRNENYDYREMLVKDSINDDLKYIKNPVNFCLFLLNKLAQVKANEDEDEEYEYIDFEYDNHSQKLDYLFDMLNSYKHICRRQIKLENERQAAELRRTLSTSNKILDDIRSSKAPTGTNEF